MTDNITPQSAAPLQNRHSYSLRLHPAMHAELVRLAKESGVPLHAYLIDILNKHIRRKRSAHGR
jgi:predicted HicB family RNase H-like nuclease